MEPSQIRGSYHTERCEVEVLAGRKRVGNQDVSPAQPSLRRHQPWDGRCSWQGAWRDEEMGIEQGVMAHEG